MEKEPKVIEQKKIDQFYYMLNNRSTFGLVNLACFESGLDFEDIPFDCSKDEWEKKVDHLEAIKKDWIESKLLELIDAGDPNAIIFYCQTKLKNRGYKK